MSLCVHVGIQLGGLFANGPKQLCFESCVGTTGERSYILVLTLVLVIILNLALFACF